jgi:large subunit ribosomal protein L31e
MSAEFDERVMTIPLRDVLAESTGQRADKAMSLIREHLARHFDVNEADVRLDPSVNEAVWERGRSKPPSELRVRAARFEEDGEAVVEAEPA